MNRPNRDWRIEVGDGSIQIIDEIKTYIDDLEKYCDDLEMQLELTKSAQLIDAIDNSAYVGDLKKKNRILKHKLKKNKKLLKKLYDKIEQLTDYCKILEKCIWVGNDDET